MWNALLNVLKFFGAGSVRGALTGAGLGIASSAFILILIKKLTDQAVSNFSSGTGSVIFQLLGLSGFDIAISVVIGALITRATIQSFSLRLTKSS